LGFILTNWRVLTWEITVNDFVVARIVIAVARGIYLPTDIVKIFRLIQLKESTGRWWLLFSLYFFLLSLSDSVFDQLELFPRI